MELIIPAWIFYSFIDKIYFVDVLYTYTLLDDNTLFLDPFPIYGPERICLGCSNSGSYFVLHFVPSFSLLLILTLFF